MSTDHANTDSITNIVGVCGLLNAAAESQYFVSFQYCDKIAKSWRYASYDNYQYPDQSWNGIELSKVQGKVILIHQHTEQIRFKQAYNYIRGSDLVLV